jgi:hypothetical protein
MRSFAGNLRFCLVVVAGLGLLVSMSGCWTGSRMPSGHRSTSGIVPELKSASGHSFPRFEFLQWRQGLTLLRVDDISGREDSERDFYHDAGTAWNENGARYEWRLDTTDGNTATFRINENEYDLSEGTLFVIKAKDDKVEVHQLNRDLAALPFDSAAIRNLLKNDAEVRKIFGVKEEDK